MKYALKPFFQLSVLIFMVSCAEHKTDNNSPSGLSHYITPSDIKTHIAYLADDMLRGREAGTAGEARAANYIADYFREFGLEPAGESATYYQEFVINPDGLTRPDESDSNSSEETRIARNVIGLIEGTKESGKYIVIGAHYDHLGMGSFGSLESDSASDIHNGADDNASGTAGLLELAQYFSRRPPERSILFIAFSGEEMGLLGSQYFVEHPVVPLDRMLAMINMDMIGRLEQNKLLIFGTGSSGGWPRLIEEANTGSLAVETIPDGTGASDHTSFYNMDIPVLHYFTDTHADYHRPSDDTEHINFEGESQILEHIVRVVEMLNTLPEGQLAYKEAPSAPHSGMRMDGVTLGVTPDYSFKGDGMRITGVRSDGPAGKAGLQNGDVIVKLDGRELQDIYEYMDVLNDLEKGETSTVTVKRDGQELTFELDLQ